DAFGQGDASDAVLDVRVLVAHVDAARIGAVERHAGRFQEYLRQRLVFGAGLPLDLGLAELVSRGTDAWLDLDARLFQPLGRDRNIQRRPRREREGGARVAALADRYNRGGGLESIFRGNDPLRAGCHVGEATPPLLVGRRLSDDPTIACLEPRLHGWQRPVERVLGDADD